VAIEDASLVRCRRAAGKKRRRRVAELDGDAFRLLVDAIGDVARDDLIAAVAVEQQEALEAVFHQALRRLEVDLLNGLRG
jgi:hypothetical protein